MEKEYNNITGLHDNIMANGREFSGDYTDKTLRSMKLVNCTFKDTIFNDAAVTGSKFEKCIFDNCNMDQGDFEYSDFLGCSLASKHSISISFNNSNFIDTKIKEITFNSSTFTNAFFDNVYFSNVTINNCTLEATSFYHCHFLNTILTNLNLNFSEFIDPDFQDSIFPQAQILNTFGLLQYMMSTKKTFELGDHNGNQIMDSDVYINEELPKILNKLIESDNMNMYGKKFAIINVLLAYGEKQEALRYLRTAFQEAVLFDDLRMIRYYCKLISFSELFTMGERRQLYNDINSSFHMEVMPPWKLKNYSRQMGEIRYTLLKENSLPTLIFYAATNLINESINKVGILMDHIFSISRKYKKTHLRDIKIEITQNSPIHLTIYFTETIESITALFKDLKNLSNTFLPDSYLKNELDPQNYINEDIRCYAKLYNEQNIIFKYLGVQVENWKQEYGRIFQIEG